MSTTLFTITDTHGSRFGDRTTESLRADAFKAVGPSRLWLHELAAELDRARFNCLNDAPPALGWTIALPDTAEEPAPIWRKKHGHRHPDLLRNLREASQASWSDAAAARIADLGDALERDGYQRLHDAPENWCWVPGGRA